MQASEQHSLLPSIRVDVVEQGNRSRASWLRCEIGENLHFSTEKLESYCLAPWQPVVSDAFLLAAAVEFCDKICRRPALGWGREIELRVPVHELQRWQCQEVSDSLHAALDLLTGDHWQVSFVHRKKATSSPRQGQFVLPNETPTIIPFSDGLDSRAVAGLMAKELGDNLLRVRLGSKTIDRPGSSERRQPFTSVPYRVWRGKHRFAESSARSRGFKFAMLSGIAAYLVQANQIIVSESGQGALGPSLVTVGQAYEDYRNHPLFLRRMETFFSALFSHRVHFEFPRLWYTKGETLKQFISEANGTSSWSDTWSCWQQSRQVSVNNHKRQCGICAACMLRRLSVHAAGLHEKKSTYIWEDLSAETFERGAAHGFKKITKAQREYAIAGTLHLDHLAGLRHSPAHVQTLKLSAFQLGVSLGISEADAQTKLDRLLTQHEAEWKNFVRSLGEHSFISNWAVPEYE